jgi:predicted SAM-dependent methyltransferase
MIKINLGCGWRNFRSDWIHIDGGDYDHLDYKDITKLEFDDNSVELIYVSHVLEYFDINEAKQLLREWRRVLKPGGELRVAVPDFEAMNVLYHNGKVTLNDIIGPLYGRMQMGEEIIYHKTTYDYETLYNLLYELAYNNIKRYDWRNYEVHRQNDDHSQAYLNPKGDKDNGTLISLNVTCNKIG